VPSPELLEVIRWNRDQAVAAREMADRARRAGRDEDAVLRREQTATFHDRVADRAEELALEPQQGRPAARPDAVRPDPGSEDGLNAS
jgi:hypothetical protein